jgi:hypothetical protein
MYIPVLNFEASLVGALLAGITLMFLIDSSTSAEGLTRTGHAVRLTSAITWLAVLPIMFGIVFVVLALIPSLIFAALTLGSWLGAIPGI